MQNRTVLCDCPPFIYGSQCDAIIVLDHGEIIERGSHEELLKQKGRYYQLYTGQFELD